MGADDYVHIGWDMAGIYPPTADFNGDVTLLGGGVEAVVFFALYSRREDFDDFVPASKA
jgi:hypothetical protein